MGRRKACHLGFPDSWERGQDFRKRQSSWQITSRQASQRRELAIKAHPCRFALGTGFLLPALWLLRCIHHSLSRAALRRASKTSPRW